MSIGAGRVLYVGQAYYNAWYLSRALRKLGWKADVLNWNLDAGAQPFYHGEDFTSPLSPALGPAPPSRFYL